MMLSHWDIVEKDTELLACGFLTHPGTNWFVNDRILVLITKCCPIEHLLFRKYQYGTALYTILVLRGATIGPNFTLGGLGYWAICVIHSFL